MDIDLLSKMVKELILDNDRVVLPGLGCFVAEIVPSTFSDKGYTINPPYRRLYFRAKPNVGDALAAFYAESNSIQPDVAERIISDFITELKTVLLERKTVVFPGLGRLRATRENAVFFVADEDLDIYPEGFALEPISMKTHVETPEDVSAAIMGLKTVVEEVSECRKEPLPDPESEELPALESEAEGLPAQESDVEELTDKESEAEGLQDPEPQVLPVAESDTSQVSLPEKKSFWKIFAMTFLWVILTAAVLLGAFIATARLRPDLTDKILYTPDELKILNQ